jgi:hypothetical protein
MRSMKLRALILLFAGALAAPLHAQDLPPEVRPTATKYAADTAALDAQKAAEISRVAQAYTAALDAAEKAETAAARLAAVTAITVERDAVKQGEANPEPPSDLPKGLHTARKTYLDGIERVLNDFGQRQQRVTAEYLRALGTIETRAGSNRALTDQIGSEKKRVVESIGIVLPMGIAGVWAIKYDNGHARRYAISALGAVIWLDEDGVKPPAHRETKVARQGADLLVDWGDDGKIERISLARGHLHVEHFNPKDKYLAHAAPLIGTGTKEIAK